MNSDRDRFRHRPLIVAACVAALACGAVPAAVTAGAQSSPAPASAPVPPPKPDLREQGTAAAPGGSLASPRGEDGAQGPAEGPAEARVPEEPATGGPDAAVEPDGTAGDVLDLAELEAQLRATSAIGFFTKLSLRNEIDDLLGEFDRFHRNAAAASIDRLRQRFNLLLMKVVTLLQDEEPDLSERILAARPHLWSALMDPESFRNL